MTLRTRLAPCTIPRMAHDQFFKLLLMTFFVEFVRAFLPDVARYIDFSSIEFLDKEIFSDIASGDSHEVDLIVKVRFRGGKQAFFLIHVENQASSRKDFARRMFLYFARLHEMYGLPIFPVAIFSFDKPLRPEPDRYQVEFPDFRVLDFAFRAIQLNRLNWRDFVRTPNPVASALMTRMQIATEDRPRVKLECMRMIATLKLDKARSLLIAKFMNNYLNLTSRETIVYNKMIGTVAPKERKGLMTLTQFMKDMEEEQRQEGRRQGRQEGRQEGARDLLLRLLRKRFGSIPVKLSKQVERLDDAAMLALAEAVLDFTKPADAQQWLAKRGQK
jgi:predicted transposase YdaD